jgi:nucleotide-binding universal stress UspA family protein
MAAPVLLTATAPRLKNILFATDFSEDSLLVLPCAGAIARAFEAKIYLCHVQADVPLSAGLAAPHLYEAAGKDAAEHLAALRSLPALKGLELKLVLASGMIQDEMQRIIHENGIDLLVAGTRGRTGLSKMMLGSVVEDICRVATCPILTVGPEAEVWPEAPFRNVLFPSNLSEMSRKALPYISLLARKYKSRVTVLHVLSEDQASAADAKEVTESTRKTMTNTFRTALDEFQPEFIVASGSTAEAVLRVAREKQANLVALGIRNAFRPGILRERTAYRIMAGARCPVLTVP